MSLRIVNKRDFESYPHPSDYKSTKNLPTKKIVGHSEANNILFSNKPWGFECLQFRNQHFDIWELSISPHSSTSSHIHTKKDSLLITLDGSIILATTSEKKCLITGDFRLSKHGTLHKLINNSKSTARVLEIESPPDRNDLLRIEDGYGRTGLPYLFNHSQSENKKCDLLPKKFFHKPQEKNPFFEVSIFIPHQRKKNDLQILWIIFRKEISLKKPLDLDFFQKHPVIKSLRSFFILQGNVSLKKINSAITLAKQGDCFIIPDPSEIIRVSKDAILIGWK